MLDAIIYYGHHDLTKFKRGVENVIISQRDSLNILSYYIFLGKKLRISYHERFICIEIPKRLQFLYINFIVFIIKNIKKKRIIIHSHHYMMTLFSLFKTDIFTTHDAIGYFKQFDTYHSNLFYKVIFFLIEKIIYKKSNNYHFISEFSLSNSLLCKKKKKSSFIIGNTTPIEKLKVDFVPNQDIISVHENFAFCLRSMDTRYNIDLLIDSACELVEYNKNFRIVVAGKGPLLQHYRNKVKEMKIENVVFVGYISNEELLNYLYFCDFTIVTASWGEGFGIPVIESYLFDKISIAPNICAFTENIINNNHLYENNRESFVTAVKSVYNHRKEDYYNYYIKNYGNSVIESLYREMYRGVR